MAQDQPSGRERPGSPGYEDVVRGLIVKQAQLRGGEAEPAARVDLSGESPVLDLTDRPTAPETLGDAGEARRRAEAARIEELERRIDRALAVIAGEIDELTARLERLNADRPR